MVRTASNHFRAALKSVGISWWPAGLPMQFDFRARPLKEFRETFRFFRSDDRIHLPVGNQYTEIRQCRTWIRSSAGPTIAVM